MILLDCMKNPYRNVAGATYDQLGTSKTQRYIYSAFWKNIKIHCKAARVNCLDQQDTSVMTQQLFMGSVLTGMCLLENFIARLDLSSKALDVKFCPPLLKCFANPFKFLQMEMMAAA